MSTIRFKSKLSKSSLYELFGHVPARVFVSPKSYLDIGRFSYGAISRLIMWRNGDFEGLLLKVGDFCEFSSQTAILAGGEHENDSLNNFTFSSSPTFQKLLNRNGIKTTHARKGPVVFGDGVIVSYAALVMSGVTVADGVVIAAGAVVTKNCEAYSVYGGVPAKKISTRPGLEKTLAEIKGLNTIKLLEYFSKQSVSTTTWKLAAKSKSTMRLVVKVDYPENYQPGQMYDFKILGAVDEASQKTFPIKNGSEFHNYAAQIEKVTKGEEFEWHPDPLTLGME